MKKFIVFLVIILILGGAGFFLGWAQLNVPQGSYGVIRSKIQGIDPQIVKEGEFRWLWYKLIPTNTEIKVFTPKTITRSFRSSGSLPSADIYTTLAGLNASTLGASAGSLVFNWEISGEISFSIRPESLPVLCERENINSDTDLRNLENEFANRIETFVTSRIISIGQNESFMETIMLPGSMAGINREIETTFPELEKINCVVRTVKVPDYQLYNSVRELYRDYITHQQDYLRNDVLRNAESVIGTQLRFDELEKYGEILTRYPILMQLLALEKGFAPVQP